MKYQETNLIWQGIKLIIRYNPNHCNSIDPNNPFRVVHLEIISENRVPIPITETGYRSHFTHAEEIEAYENPNNFVKEWLTAMAKSKEWQTYWKKRNQLRLF